MDAQTPHRGRGRTRGSFFGQEAWYLLAALLGFAGIVSASGGLAPQLGLLALLLSSACFGVGVLMHSAAP